MRNIAAIQREQSKCIARRKIWTAIVLDCLAWFACLSSRCRQINPWSTRCFHVGYFHWSWTIPPIAVVLLSPAHSPVACDWCSWWMRCAMSRHTDFLIKIISLRGLVFSFASPRVCRLRFLRAAVPGFRECRFDCASHLLVFVVLFVILPVTFLSACVRFRVSLVVYCARVCVQTGGGVDDGSNAQFDGWLPLHPIFIWIFAQNCFYKRLQLKFRHWLFRCSSSVLLLVCWWCDPLFIAHTLHISWIRYYSWV